MKTSVVELRRLRERFGTTESLASEMDAFLTTLENENDSIQLSRKLLAEAAQAIQSNHLDVAHEFVGAAIDTYSHERLGEDVTLPKALMATLSASEFPPEGVMDGVPLPELTNAPTFEEANEEVVSGFANLLVTAGYVEEAGTYLSGYKTLMATGQGEERVMKDIDTLKKLRSKFKAEANLNMVRSIDQIIAEVEEEAKDVSLDEPTEVAPPADEAAPADAPVPVEAPIPADGVPPAPPAEGEEEKPVLEIEPEGDEEKKEKESAEASIKSGNAKKARTHLMKAKAMERARIIAALVKVGDFDLAAEGLSEAEAEEVHTDEVLPEEKSAGLTPAVEPKEEELTSEELPEEVKDKIEQPAEGMEDEEDETEEAGKICASVKRLVKKKMMKQAVAGLTKLDTLEKAIMAGVEKAEVVQKDAALAAEGYKVWKGVRKSRLEAEIAIAEGEGDEKAKDEAMEAMEALEGNDESLEDTLEGQPAESKELTQDMITPAGGKPEVAPGTPAAPVMPTEECDTEECEEEEHDEEAEAMKTEVLQSVASLKGMKVSSDDLAFTFWNQGNDPFWTVQACGKPVAEVHLEDQTDSSAIADFFTDEQKWPSVVAQTTSKVGLYEMLKGVNARFYANQMEKGKLAVAMKEQALAEVKKASATKLATIRHDLTDAVMVAAEQLNKGLIPGKQNALKKAFSDRLMSLGIHNPALIVEDCFADGFNGFMAQVMADANDLIEMPKEAFAHTRKMVSAATNMAQSMVNNHSHETLANRLGRTSMTMAPVAPAMEAPVVQEVEAEFRRESASDSRQTLRKKLKLSAKF